MFDAEGSWLFLDASGVQVRAGVWQNSRWRGWREGEAAALESLFTGTDAALQQAGVPLEKLNGFLYVEGPGSVLGLRLAAMAIRAWRVDDAARSCKTRPVWACGSLHLAAALAMAGGVQPPFAVFTDARQGFWQIMEITSGKPAGLATLAPREIAETELPLGLLFHIPARKAWHRAPPQARPLPAALGKHPEIIVQPGLFRLVETPEPYAGRAPEYKKWAGAAASAKT